MVTHAGSCLALKAELDSPLDPTAAALAAPSARIRWCLKSEAEYQKCKRLEVVAPAISCVPMESTMDCIVAIRVRKALEHIYLMSTGSRERRFLLL